MSEWFEVLVKNMDYIIDEDGDYIFFRRGASATQHSNWKYIYCPPNSLSIKPENAIRVDKLVHKNRELWRWIRAPKRMRKVLKAVAFPHVLEDPNWSDEDG